MCVVLLYEFAMGNYSITSYNFASFATYRRSRLIYVTTIKTWSCGSAVSTYYYHTVVVTRASQTVKLCVTIAAIKLYKN